VVFPDGSTVLHNFLSMIPSQEQPFPQFDVFLCDAVKGVSLPHYYPRCDAFTGNYLPFFFCGYRGTLFLLARCFFFPFNNPRAYGVLVSHRGLPAALFPLSLASLTRQDILFIDSSPPFTRTNICLGGCLLGDSCYPS